MFEGKSYFYKSQLDIKKEETPTNSCSELQLIKSAGESVISARQLPTKNERQLLSEIKDNCFINYDEFWVVYLPLS